MVWRGAVWCAVWCRRGVAVSSARSSLLPRHSSQPSIAATLLHLTQSRHVESLLRGEPVTAEQFLCLWPISRPLIEPQLLIKMSESSAFWGPEALFNPCCLLLAHTHISAKSSISFPFHFPLQMTSPHFGFGLRGNCPECLAQYKLLFPFIFHARLWENVLMHLCGCWRLRKCLRDLTANNNNVKSQFFYVSFYLKHLIRCTTRI